MNTNIFIFDIDSCQNNYVLDNSIFITEGLCSSEGLVYSNAMIDVIRRQLREYSFSRRILVVDSISDLPIGS